MVSRRAVTALVLVQLIALAVSAQDASEFRASGGEIIATTKGTAPFSGSISVSLSSGRDVFGRTGNSPGYGVTAGGTLIQDRLWFFGSASQQQTPYARLDLDLPQNATTSAIGGRINGQLGASQDFSAFFQTARQPQFSTTAASPLAATGPSSFLSLRYNGIVSNNMFFSASVTRSSRSVQGLSIVPVE